MKVFTFLVDFNFHSWQHRKRQQKKKSKKKESAPKVSPKMVTTKRKGGTTRLERTNPRVWLYSVLLTLQYGAQPLISKRFTRSFPFLSLLIPISNGFYFPFSSIFLSFSHWLFSLGISSIQLALFFPSKFCIRIRFSLFL